jgi:hypothetical protein
MSNFIALDPGLNGAGAILDRHVEIHVSFRYPDDRRRRTTPGAPRLWEASMMDLRFLAHVLGGEVGGGQVSCPGPGHGPRGRSLSVRHSATALDGFIAFSHAGDDWRVCRAGARRPRR